MEVCLCHRIPILMSVHKIGLIVVDSVAAPYRVEDWKTDSRNRSRSLRIIGEQLHKLCNNDLCIICINQVKRYKLSSQYQLFCFMNTLQKKLVHR